jgi:hypothetical protein
MAHSLFWEVHLGFHDGEGGLGTDCVATKLKIALDISYAVERSIFGLGDDGVEILLECGEEAPL